MPSLDLGREGGELLLVGAADAVDEVVAHRADEHDRREAEREREEPGGDERDAPADGQAPHQTLGAEPVTRAADGPDQLAVEGLVDLAAEVADVHLDDVRVAGEVDAPHVIEDLALRRDVAVAAHEVLEQRELARGELDRLAVALGAPGAGVEAQRSDLEHRGARRRAAAEQRAQPGEQDHERERLREEVVGAGVEGLGLVPLAVLRGEHQDRRPHALVAQGLAHLEPVHAGQEDVEDDGVVANLRVPATGRRAVVDDVDVVALGHAVLPGPLRPRRLRLRR